MDEEPDLAGQFRVMSIPHTDRDQRRKGNQSGRRRKAEGADPGITVRGGERHGILKQTPSHAESNESCNCRRCGRRRYRRRPDPPVK